MADKAQSAFPLPSEMRLLLQCARWPLREADCADIRTLVATHDIDWKFFLILCGHHGIMPIVYRGLSTAAVDVPAFAIAALKARATENALSV